MTLNRHPVFLFMATMILISGCSRYDVIPDRLEPQVNKNVVFDQLERSPATYQGQMVVLGGQVLATKRLGDKTQVEVLQLPLSDDYIPIVADRTQSKGRFYAYDSGKEISTRPHFRKTRLSRSSARLRVVSPEG